MSEYALEMLGVTKIFSKVTALNKVNLRVRKGEIHALIGENGAGKSTLMKVLSGVYKADAGSIRLFGEQVELKNPQAAINRGVSIIYQELSLVPDLNAIENVMLGNEIHKGILLNKKQEKEFATRYLDYVSHGGITDYHIPVRKLSVAQQQMIDIAKSLSHQSRIIIMDEPTDSLTQSEITILFRIVRKLKEDGITVIYISHRLEELFELCDRVTVLRDGEYVADRDISEIDKNWLISNMIGRDLKDTFPKRDRVFSEEIVLEAENLTGNRFRDVSLRMKKGEILGLTGLVGAGRTEVLRAIFGADNVTAGTVRLHGKTVNIKHPSTAIACGMGFATEDRKSQGLFLNQDICTNIAISSPKKVARYGLVSRRKEKELASRYFNELKVVAPDIYKLCKHLSGGNQQKVVLAKWLASDCEILFLDEPTRGIDVGAKYEIYVLMNRLVQKGVSILVVSSEMAEIIGIADRILVMHEGRITGELTQENFSEENIMKLASGENIA